MKRISPFFQVIAAIALIFSLVIDAAAQSSPVYIKVGEANLKKSLLALPPFLYVGTPSLAKNHAKVGKELYDTVFNDLGVSGYFEFIKPDAYLEDTSKVGLRPAPGQPDGFKFENWKSIGTEFLIRVGFKILNNELTTETFLYYVPQAKTVLAKTYKSDIGNVRFVAHTMANDMVKELTGKKGIFLTKLVTVRTTQPQQKEVFIMDWDGHSPKQITNHKSISISPAWSPDGNMIAYTQFAFHQNQGKRNADLFTYDLAGGKRWLVSYREGLNSGANFLPDGRSLLLTISQGGNPDIYKMSIDGKSAQRITNGPRGAMNVEPAVSPAGKKIAFSSDRSGKPMIYVMGINGDNPVRMTIAGEYNSTPVWSPDGKKIAFAGHDASHFDLFLMNADGTNMVRLTSAKRTDGKWANNEFPSFSPDGRQILFSSDRTGVYQLYITNLDGSDERRITFDKHEYTQPRWSPYLD